MLLEFIIGMIITAAPIILVVSLVALLLKVYRPSPSRRDQLDARAWDQAREIGRLEQEIADLKRRIGDLERRQQPFSGD
ncbi:MAG: hypothetical protein H0U38_08275 [Chloroflexia bacterium]|jgi:cell division protein FtsL|nr:hypothetical protein [Chloroflexia bacterium]